MFVPMMLRYLLMKRGEVANRILTVGSAKRAEMLAEKLLKPQENDGTLFRKLSSRGFVTLSGTPHNEPHTAPLFNTLLVRQDHHLHVQGLSMVSL